MEKQTKGGFAVARKKDENRESGMLSNILLILIVIVSLAEMGTAIYKTLKYAQTEKN